MIIHSIILGLHRSLGATLKGISAHVDIQASASLVEEVHTAILFHQEMEPRLNSLMNEYEENVRKLADFRDKTTVVDTDMLLKLVKKYNHFRELGATPLIIHKMSLDDYITERDQPRVLCTVFKISTEEAQSIIQQYNTNFR